MAREARKPPSLWARSGIGELRLVEEGGGPADRVCWTIRELLSSKELREEGRAMNHCVASYARSCAKGQTSIWSMQVEECGTGVSRRAMTIAVNNARRIINQARGRCNRLPGARDCSVRLNEAPRILRLWAQQEGLMVAKHL